MNKTNIAKIFIAVVMITSLFFSGCSGLLQDAVVQTKEQVADPLLGSIEETVYNKGVEIMECFENKNIEKFKSLFSVRARKEYDDFDRNVDELFDILPNKIEYFSISTDSLISSENPSIECKEKIYFPEEEWTSYYSAGVEDWDEDAPRITYDYGYNNIIFNNKKYTVSFIYYAHYRYYTEERPGPIDDPEWIGIYNCVVYDSEAYEQYGVQAPDENGVSNPSVTDVAGFYFYP